MPNETMTSCILCLEAFDRSTMLEVALRHGGAGEVPSHIICMKCGAAIAAEYLYRERAQRPQPQAEQQTPEPLTPAQEHADEVARAEQDAEAKSGA